jgi:soluble lytic murein transglycosylase
MRVTLKQIQIQMVLTSLLILLVPQIAAAKSNLILEQREARLAHAQELLGRYYKRSVVRTGEDVKKINGFIYRSVKESLPKKYKDRYQEVAQAIIDESLKYEFDPVFLLAVIENESHFNPLAKGSVGELGLMQIRPTTAQQIAEKNDIKWSGSKTLRDPVMNVKIGAAFMSALREKFDSHARLYLSAYNMGQTAVRRNLKENKWPKEYSQKVMNYYVDFYAKLKDERAPAIAAASSHHLADNN